MARTSEFGRTLGFLAARFEVILKARSNLWRKIAELVPCDQIILGLLNLSPSPSLIILSSLFGAFLWPKSPASQTPSSGLTIMGYALSNRPLNASTINTMCLRINKNGTGYGLSHAPKRFNSSSGKQCISVCPPITS